MVSQQRLGGGDWSQSNTCGISTPIQHMQDTAHVDTGHRGLIVTAGDAVQGNCLGAGEAPRLGPPRQTERQCVVTVWEDWLECGVAGSYTWVSDFYVQVPVSVHANECCVLLRLHWMHGIAVLTFLMFCCGPCRQGMCLFLLLPEV